MWGKVFTRNFLLNKILLDLDSWVHGARIYTYLPISYKMIDI